MATWSTTPQTSSRHKGHQPELEHLFDGGAEDVPTDDHRLHTSMRAPLLGINVIEVEGSTRGVSVLGLPTISPTGYVVLVQLIVMGCLDASYTAFKVPISFAITTNRTSWSLNNAVDLAAGALFTMDILLRFHTGVLKVQDQTARVVTDGRAIAWHYMLHGSFVIDLLATLPAWAEATILIALPDEDTTGHVFLSVISALRLLRLLRLARWVRAALLMSMGGRLGKRLVGLFPVTVVYLSNIMYAMAVLINLLGCVWLFTARCEGYDQSWLTSVGGVDMSGAPVADKYVVAVHFAMTTMATVGYGDVTPIHTVERLVAMGIMTVGVFFFGFLIGALAELVQAASSSASRAALLHTKIKAVEAWLHARKLPRELRADVTSYFSDTWVDSAETHEAELLAELPQHLRGHIVGSLLQDELASLEPLRGVHHETLGQLAAGLKPRAVPAGHDVCRPGEPCACLWVLQRGAVAVLEQHEVKGVLQSPALLGDPSVLEAAADSSGRHTCGFRAQGSCMVWELPVRELHILLWLEPHLRGNLELYLASTSRRENGVLHSLESGLQRRPSSRAEL